MIVLDTNIVSELMKPKPDANVGHWLQNHADVPFLTTVITVHEIEYGLERLPDGKRKSELHSRLEELLQSLTVLPLDTAASIKAAQFRAFRDSVGLSSSLADMLIAGIAASVGAILATRNVPDFDKLPIQINNPFLAN